MSATAGWQAVALYPEGSAVIPLDDLIVHDVSNSGDCPCEALLVPVIEGERVGFMWEHQALDGRCG